ncbi:anti-sigma-D factor RsdA [Mycobacterium sp. NPDC006124]|uniref:anti-sigma-D factor RsdA n=1 Tax=Mycobacterium sp. NPDC006124 TaxID=3156729 RepID=UPI0033A6D9B0
MPDSNRWNNGGEPSLDEINRADRFFEALASKQPAYPTDHAEAELAFLFSGLRDDVRDAPLTAPVSLGDAVDALNGGLAKNRGSRRSLAVVGSVAAAMLCIGGFGTAVYGAAPGDSLYGMRTALFGQHEETRDDQVSLASAQLQQVQQLIDDGQWEEAQSKLVAVSSTVQDVGQVEQKQQLVEQWNALTYKVVEQDPAATLAPGEPLPALPSSPLTWLPVPVVETTPSSDTTTTQTSDTTTSETSGTSGTSGTSPTSPSESTTSSTTLPSDSSTTTSSPVSSPASSTTAPTSPASSSTAVPSTSSPTASTAPTSTAPAGATTPTGNPAPSSSSAAASSAAPSSTPAPSTAVSSTTTTVTRQPAASAPAEEPAAPSRSTAAPAVTTPIQPSPQATTAAPVAPTTTTTIPPG